jgi:hypothetical protein
VHPNEKKKPFSLYHAHCSGTPQGAPPTKKKENLFPLTLSVVARRKGRHQQKKKKLYHLSRSKEWKAASGATNNKTNQFA